MKISQTIVVLLLSLLGACPAQVKAQSHPMVDGKNTEYHQLGVIPVQLAEGVQLYVFQNDSYVWISYDFPEGSYATLDMALKTEKLPKALNLHVSAQLGEWPLGEDAQIPMSASSELWWNNQGWTANTLWPNGIDSTSQRGPQIIFKNGTMREVQLDKKRFGRGEWKVRLEINALRSKEGRFTSLTFPESGMYFSIPVK